MVPTTVASKQAALPYFGRSQRTPIFDPKNPQTMKQAFQEAGAFEEWCTRALSDEENSTNTQGPVGDLLHFAKVIAESKGPLKGEASCIIMALEGGRRWK